MNGLILHCGASAIDRHAIMALPEPESRGPRHQPVHHGDYLQMVDAAIQECGLTVTEEAFGVTRKGERFFGLMQVRGAGIVDGHDEYGFVIGLRGAHDMSLPRGLAGGGRVFVCDNLGFSGETVMATRQTTHVMDRLPNLVLDVVRGLSGWSERLADQYDAYKRQTLTPSQADALLTGMVRRGVVMPSEMGRLIDEWDEPSHEEFAEGATVWRAFNAATETLKPRNPETPRIAMLAPKTAALHALCDEACGVH